MHKFDPTFIAASVPSALLSLSCSSAIIFMILRGGGTRLSKMHNRLLLPMSICDIFQSIFTAFSSALTPSGSSSSASSSILDSSPSSFGTSSSCTAQAFFIQLGFIAPAYTAALCMYYLMVIRYNTRDDVVKKLEPYMHAFAILPSFIIAIIAASTNMFNDACSMCWIATTTTTITTATTDQVNNDGESPKIIMWLFYLLNALVLILLVTNFLIIAVSMYLITDTVQEREMKMNSYNFQRPGRNSNPHSIFNNLSKTTNDTVTQALIYVTGFIVTYSFFIVHTILTNFVHMHPSSVLTTIQCITLPLQGFWNFWAYIRPRFHIVKAEQPNSNFFSVLLKTIMKEPDQNPPQYSRSSSNVTSRLRRTPQRSERMFVVSNAASGQGSPMGVLNDNNNHTCTDINEDIEQAHPSTNTTPLPPQCIHGSNSSSAKTKHDSNCTRKDEETLDTTKSGRRNALYKIDEIDMSEVHPTLSLLVAQDFLPIQQGAMRRRSMYDLRQFPLRNVGDDDSDVDDSGNDGGTRLYDVRRYPRRKKERRHSCSN